MHVIITGGSSGIGAAVADIYAGRGLSVSLIARGQEMLSSKKAALREANPGACVHTEAADICDEPALAAAIFRCGRALGPCDILVTSAGTVLPGRFDVQTAQDFAAQLNVNLLGSVNAVRAVYGGMLERRSGHVVLIASGAGLTGIHGYSAYCASKFALTGFAEALRQEARPLGVRVSICYPTDTMTRQLEAELPLRSPEAAAIIGPVVPRSAESVAKAIVSGVDRGHHAIYPTVQMALLARLGGIAAPWIRSVFDRRIDAVQARRP